MMVDPLSFNRRGLPRVAYGDPVKGARAVADMIETAVAQAEAVGASEVAGHLRMALAVAERQAGEVSVVDRGEAGSA